MPVLPIIAEALAAYLAACPAPPCPTSPCSRARGANLQQGVVQKQVRQLRVGLGLPETGDTRTPCATVSPPTPPCRHGSARDPGTVGARHLSTTQGYTEVDARRLISLYANTHPRA